VSRPAAPATPARLASAKAPDKRRERMMAAMMLAMLGAGLWWFGGATQRGPRLLGSLGGRREDGEALGAAAAPAAVVGGIGRFARPRVGRPQPLT
jgi:hypothetical protein